MPSPYPPEFRRCAVETARLRGKPVGVMAKELGIAESCLRRWMAQTAVNAVKPGWGEEETVELAQLRRENKRLEAENKLLKQAAACFARAVFPE